MKSPIGNPGNILNKVGQPNPALSVAFLKGASVRRRSLREEEVWEEYFRLAQYAASSLLLRVATSALCICEIGRRFREKESKPFFTEIILPKRIGEGGKRGIGSFLFLVGILGCFQMFRGRLF